MVWEVQVINMVEEKIYVILENGQIYAIREGCETAYRIKTTEDLRDMINTGRTW